MATLPTAERKRVCGKLGCGNLLLIEGPAKAGKFPGHYYFHCHACGWHYTLGLSDPSSSSIITSAVAPGIIQVSKCVGVNGRGCRKNAHGSCSRQSCRSCCVAMGGCREAKGHCEAQLSDRQRTKSRIMEPNNSRHQQPPLPLEPTPASTSTPVRATSPVYFGELAQMLSESNPVLRLQLEDKRRQQAKQLAEDQELAKELQEEEEHQALLAATRAALSSLPATPGPSTAAAPDSPIPSTMLVGSGLPVTRVTSSNRPLMTTQMNPTWMRDYEDQTKKTRRIGGNGQIDLEMVQKFRIIWWEAAGSDPSIFTVQECPCWPKWKITDSPSTLKRLGRMALQFYDLDHKVWIESSPLYPHSVCTDCYILFRCTSIECHNFELHLSAAQRKPVNQRLYFSAVRQSLKSETRKAKGKARAITPLEDSEGEVEIVEPSMPKREPHPDHLRPSKRPRLSPLVIPSTSGSSPGNPITLDSPYRSPPTTTSSTDSTRSFFPLLPINSPSVASSISSRSTTPIPSPSPSPTLGPLDLSVPSREPLSLIPGRVWPSNMYVKDMVEGFLRMDALKNLGKGNYEDRFREVFKQDPPKRNTYHDQVRRWSLAPRSIAAAALAAGTSEEGQWSRFSKLSPLKKGL